MPVTATRHPRRERIADFGGDVEAALMAERNEAGQVMTTPRPFRTVPCPLCSDFEHSVLETATKCPLSGKPFATEATR